MLKIGLTGGIGSGKSTISNILKKKNFIVIDADIVARDVLRIYPEIFENIRKEFGEEFFDEKKELKRKEFGNYIFSKDDRRKKYEDMIMPFIRKRICDLIEKYQREGVEVCFLDGATIIENNLHKYMDINILVWVDSETQLHRVSKRDNLTEQQVINRVNSQMSLEDKKEFVDYIIDNSKSLDNTKREVNETLKKIGEKYRGVECLKI
ncbi:dephospho-CoA kinase [Clostridium thailandense]|uniref:Dephospho-CoA kinase n=1 Tax=Clostridium thailandense TaxID=2794346 RepID=A0A949TMC2_9CLOT|nr:dephospho-CoA kinase [Clostridium thailandense]MBV7273092.1 dephospho-CoA kinase [Clostridium thailandense]MCH5135756.1 dephospho-CoA kinase [Clostridiaceae bacterium UIB06]